MPLTPQLTPKKQKQDKIDTPELPPDLAELIALWPELPEHIKAAIKALVQTHNSGNLLVLGISLSLSCIRSM
jgi:hypothetical protein